MGLFSFKLPHLDIKPTPVFPMSEPCEQITLHPKSELTEKFRNVGSSITGLFVDIEEFPTPFFSDPTGSLLLLAKV